MIAIRYKSLGVKRVVIKTNILTIGILITGLLSIVIALLTYYGSYSGNFIVVVDDDNQTDYKSIMLSEDPSFKTATPRLFADQAISSYDMTYVEINTAEIVRTNGNYKDPTGFQYLAYTFYIKNNGTETIDVDAKMLITESYRGTEKAVRVISIRDSIDQTIYQYPDQEGTPDNQYQPDYPETVPFISESEVFADKITAFEPNQIKKYTIIVFLEGQDPDCNDDLSGGRIKMSMLFTIPEEGKV